MIYIITVYFSDPCYSFLTFSLIYNKSILLSFFLVGIRVYYLLILLTGYGSNDTKPIPNKHEPIQGSKTPHTRIQGTRNFKHPAISRAPSFRDLPF